mmetsp:Transcript_6385/g.23920  ORF Transcript_6385/g.23920 Transcript_6385/m.23920 type:complete len:251 (-) Transcript_6385:247-999(-)
MSGGGGQPLDAEEDPRFSAIFPASAKLDAYGMAFDDIAAFEAAGHSRDSVGQLATYGFITYRGVRLLLESSVARLRRVATGKELGSEPLTDESAKGMRLLDLGSGDGRAVISAAFLAPSLAEAVGLELSPSRHVLAEKNHARLPERLRDVVRFCEGDILQAPSELFGAADIIYLANLRFPDDVVEAVNQRLERDCALERDAVVATLREVNFARPHEAWTEKLPMSWNPEGWTVFFYYLPSAAGSAVTTSA